MEGTIERLLQQAYLFDDPHAYRAGVEDAVAALEELRRELDEPSVLGPVETRERRSA